MQISFFEEFPTRSTLDKLKDVHWPVKLYLAAKNIKEFEAIKENIKHRNITIIYWPTLNRKEGYWISPFSKRSALLKLFGQINNTKYPVMIDAELPTTQHPFLYLTEWCHFLGNRRMIRNFIQNHKEIYVAEYYPQHKIGEIILSFLGLHFDPKRYNCKIIKMMYQSLHPFSKEVFASYLEKGKEKYGQNFIIALGTISPGIHGNEPKLSPTQLAENLRLAKEAGIKEVIIFRLGGLNEEYLKVIEKFI